MFIYCERELRSGLLFIETSNEQSVLRRFVSSANNIALNFSLAQYISFMYIIKSKGPRTEPWGTPVVSGRDLDLFPSNSTY